LGAVAVLVLAFGLRAAFYDQRSGHPDEAITVEVVGHMRQSGDLDTNWAKAPKLESEFRYDQYNFSSHLEATYGFYRLVKVLPGTASWRTEGGGLAVYRFFSVMLATVAVWQAMQLAGRLAGRAAALAAGLLAAVSTLLVQDAHFCRPEAFCTALTLAAVALCWPGKQQRALPVLAGGFALGLLMACKVSMLLIAWLPLVPVLTAESGWGWKVRLASGAMAALVAGFVMGVPGAVIHPQVFVAGVKHLMTQYAGLHPPHSHMDGGAVADLMAAYFGATLGWPLLAAGALGMGVLVVRRRWAELAVIAGPVVLFGGYFATKSVFFERNLSHVMPLGLILAALGAVEIAGWGAKKLGVPVRPLAAIGVFGLAVTSLGVTWPLVQEGFSNDVARRHERFEADLRARHGGVVWKETNLQNDGALEELAEYFKLHHEPVLMRVTDYHDEWTRFNERSLLARFSVKLVAEFPGPFPEQPVSTLITYHGARDCYYLVSGPRQP
jgi:hypothetical protein